MIWPPCSTARRARGAFTLQVVMTAPWGLDVRDQAPLSVLAVTAGEAWVRIDGEPPSVLRPGDVALVRETEPYVVADGPTTAPDVAILPGQVCVGPGGGHLDQAMSVGVSTWGNCLDGETTMLVGTYASDGEIGRRLVEALPRLRVLPAGDLGSPLTGLLAAELSTPQVGRRAALDRLVDLLVIEVVQAWPRTTSLPQLAHRGHRSLRRCGTPADPGQLRRAVDGRLSRARRRAVAGRLRPPLHRGGGPRPDRVPHRLADDGRGRPAARARGHRLHRGHAGRLPEPLHLQRGLQRHFAASARHQRRASA